MSYQDTLLWKRTLGKDDKNVEPLRESFLDARKNAQFLLDKIRKDFPNLTVHDITHVDSLWNVADTIIGEEYPINPLEGYVLGVAFLIHDAALSYETVGGKDALRDTIEWKDAYADGPGDKDLEEFKKGCDFLAIRALHARKAEGILGEMFRRDNGTTFYIVDDDVYRTHFGDLIGKIAASHHWNIDDVESKLKKQINPMSGMPKEWMINAQKLACILRCADAGHIDNGRAPDSIYRSLEVNGVSRQHWESQNHLCQVCEDADDKKKLCITSSYPFEKEDFAAWNVAYDAISLFDEELKKSNDLLKRSTPKNSKDLSFPHKGISGAESKEALATHIETDGWQPCSFGVHTSNVKALIENLGGSKLYGEDNLLLVALRELIQNARDAIQARRTMDGRPEEGRITIRFKEEKGKRWIEVEDNGIGMSLDCIKNHLLDFGSSYWKSRLAKDENPGLRSKGFNSIGKFGIGFYSVFMVAKSVEVVTRRYNKGVDDAKRIEFPEGLTLSPILSRFDDDLSSNMSTIVRFELKDVIKVIYDFRAGGCYYNVSLNQALSIVVAGLDVDVYYEEKNKSERIHSNVKSSLFDKIEWLSSIFLIPPYNISELAEGLEQIIDEKGEHRGWVLPPEWINKAKYHRDYFKEELAPCIKTIGGLSSSFIWSDLFYNNFGGYVGYIDGKEDSISRNKMAFDINLKKSLQSWTMRKYRENYDEIVASDILASMYYRLIDHTCQMGGTVIRDNVKLFYSKYREKIEVGTVNGLLKINRCLLSGVVGNLYYPGYFRDGYLERLFDSSVPESWKAEKMKEINGSTESWIVKELMEIDKLIASCYSEIIFKFCKIWKLHMFSIENIAICEWVNIMLDKLQNMMIDWNKMDSRKMDELVLVNDSKKVESSLEPYLIRSNDYLAKIGAIG